MKILIVSDTHRVDDILKKVISIEKPFDMFIHLGDGEGSETKISLMLDPTCACLMVQGNNDFFSQLPAEKEINIKNQNIIDRLKNASGNERSARFKACICAILEDGTTLFCEGSMEGLIATQTSGSNGFGYDPILYLPEYQKTSAEISPEEKNKISHRGKALTAMKQKLGEIYENIDC